MTNSVHRGRTRVHNRARWVEARAAVALARALRRTTGTGLWAGLIGRPVEVSADHPLPRDNGPGHAGVAASVRTAAQSLGFEISCLDQAVAGSLMLRRRGVPCRVVIGLDRSDPTRGSHAWLVTEDGRTVVGGELAPAFVAVTQFVRT